MLSVFFFVLFFLWSALLSRVITVSGSDERSFYTDLGKRQFKWIHDAADNSHEMSFLIWFLLKDSNKL